MARYMSIRTKDISDGPGIRVGVYFQGCPFHCPGCWNKNTWDPDGGESWELDQEDAVIEAARDEHIVGLSLLGGEPLFQPSYNACLRLIKRFKSTYPNKTIWIWSGNTFENMSEDYLAALQYCDVLVDGPFIAALRDVSQKYAGSTNQRVIDLQKTFLEKKIVLWGNDIK